MPNLDDMLRRVIAEKGSDLHLVAGDPPRMRRFGELAAIDETRLDAQATREMLYGVMPARIRAHFEQHDDADFALTREGLARFRVNVFQHLYGMGAVFRIVPAVVSSLEQMGLPASLAGLCTQKQGLILVTGKTGSGKSSTLAAMIDAVNRTCDGHIVTIEDPIEFMHQRHRCMVSQREVGQHTASFASALRSALRQDPDVILVGELRDLETMGLAVTAAETGILVMGTLHTNSAAGTVDCIINTFPAQKQPHIRTMLSTSLRSVISQQLVRRADGRGRVAAIEILINTPAVANVIREGRIDQIENILQSGSSMGMQSMDNALHKLVQAQLITGREAFDAARAKPEFDRYLPPAERSQ
ncbi:MAG: type IV pilus twitching motility protein PilT [Gammaproteobacteria bacterium]|nr:type IV pilus twitching motility protein PilT [Gammaproteobacteria bacterium]